MFSAAYLTSLWNRVTVAAPSIASEYDRRRAQRVAGFLLAAIVVTTMVLCGAVTTHLIGIMPAHWAWISLIIALTGFYVEFLLARRGHYRFASLLFIITLAPTTVFVVVFLGGRALLSVLNYASAAIILATSMFGWRAGVRTTLYNVLWTLSIPLFLPDISLAEVASVSALFQGYMLALTVAFDHLNRQRSAGIDTLRRAQISGNAETFNRLQRFIEQMPDAIIEWDADGVVKTWNPAATRLFGYPAHEVIGHKALEFLAPSDAHAAEHLGFEVMMKQPGPVYSTSQYRTADGRTITCSLINIPLNDSQGQHTGLMSIVRRSLTQENSVLHIESLLVNQARSVIAQRFGRIIAYFFRNHISEVELSRQLAARLLHDQRSADALQRLELLRGGVDRLVEQLDYFNLALQLTAAPHYLHDIRTLVGTSVVTTRQKYQERAVEIVLPTLDEPLMIRGNGYIICEALKALLRNAIDHSRPGAQVTVELGAEDQMIWITVVDHGPLLSAEQMGHMFDLFYRSDDPDVDNTDAVNVGLNVAQWIADEHGGQITIESQAQTGNAFTLWLPLADVNNDSGS